MLCPKFYLSGDMRKVVVLLGFVMGFFLKAQSCGLCNVSNTLAPRTFDPPFLTLQVGRDTEVVIQFALPETVQFFGTALYPNFAVFVDSLKMDGGNTYVSLRGSPSVAPAYNSANPSAGALRFDQAHRYKQVRSSGNTHENVVVYQNPGGSTPSNLTPPRGCVRACVRGITPTPSADTLRILLRGFVDTASVNVTFIPPSITAQDINNKDTSNLMPQKATPFGLIDLWSDVWSGYAVLVVDNSTALSASPLTALTLTPNPTWGTATVAFRLERPAAPTLSVRMTTGQEVLRVSLGQRPAGEVQHQLNLPAGIYLVELEAEGHLLRQRLVVLN